jgi:hypothetical protein
MNENQYTNANVASISTHTSTHTQMLTSTEKHYVKKYEKESENRFTRYVPIGNAGLAGGWLNLPPATAAKK